MHLIPDILLILKPKPWLILLESDDNFHSLWRAQDLIQNLCFTLKAPGEVTDSVWSWSQFLCFAWALYINKRRKSNTSLPLTHSCHHMGCAKGPVYHCPKGDAGTAVPKYWSIKQPLAPLASRMLPQFCWEHNSALFLRAACAQDRRSWDCCWSHALSSVLNSIAILPAEYRSVLTGSEVSPIPTLGCKKKKEPQPIRKRK